MEKMTFIEIIFDTKLIIKEFLLEDVKGLLTDAIYDFLIDFSKDVYDLYIRDHLSKLNILGKIASILTIGMMVLCIYLIMQAFLLLLLLYLLLAIIFFIICIIFFPLIVIFRYISQRAIRPLFRFLFIKKE